MNALPPFQPQIEDAVPLKKRAMSRRRFLLSGFGLAAAAGGGTGAYSFYEAANRLVVTPYRIVSPRWTASRPLTITAIADLHAGGPNMGIDRVREIVDTANGLRSDIVVLLGDYIANHTFGMPVAPAAWAAELKRLRAPFGVWAILGNHDWWGDVNAVRSAFSGVGIPVLENRAVALGEEGNRFWLAGLGDQLAHRTGHQSFRGEDDLPGTLAQARTGDPVILLAHEPDIFPKVPDSVALTLAGHTHGGQIRVPFIWPAFVPSRYGARYAYGHIVEDHRQMLVSGGLGTSMVPLRLGVPPEILRVEVSGPKANGGS